MRRSPSWTGWTASVALACAALAACVPRPEPTPAPTPAPAPAPGPSPVATPSPVPTYSSWMDVPATPGDWSYANRGARFGDGDYTRIKAPALELLCDLTTRTISIARGGVVTLPAQMRILTEFQQSSLDIGVIQSDPAMIRTSISANDPLLDAMAFSKGRIAVEVDGLETLYVPAWPEITRVIEDCR